MDIDTWERKAEVIQVIRTTLLKRGSGKAPDDPLRGVVQFWSLDGRLLAENDSWDGIPADQIDPGGAGKLTAMEEKAALAWRMTPPKLG